MRYVFITLSLVVALLPIGGRADTASALANDLATLQAGDILTTESILHHGGFERDALVQPVVHSVPEFVLTEGAFNYLLRKLHRPWLIRAMMGVEIITLGNNTRVLIRLSH
jgi:hypothetical protein